MVTLSKYIRFAGLFLLLIAVLSCGEDEQKPDPTPPGKTPEQLITQPRRVVKVTNKGQELPSSSFSIKFNADKTFEFDTPSISGLPQRGNWEYVSSGKIIRLNNGIDLVVVGQITESKFEFEYTYSNHKMGEVKIRFSLT